MQPPEPDKPWLLEVCPHVTLHHEGIYEPYKGTGPDRREARLRVLRALERLHSIRLDDREIRYAILEDAGGDALDSLVAAHAVARTVTDPSRVHPPAARDRGVEGYVYV